jgi:lysozyme
MTIFGPDISSYEHGLNLAELRAASFLFAKCSEGTYYTDADYPSWRSQAAARGMPFAWYHFLSGEDAASQVRHTLACVGDRGLPGMLDVENEDTSRGTFRPTFAQTLADVDAAHAAGLNLRLVYLPHWMWQQMGSPDLTPLTARGVYLVSSAYPGGSGGPAAIYPGDSAGGWAAYGGVTPLLYQFTNRASDGGQAMDYNAFRGSIQQLAAYLHTTTPTTGDDVQLTDQITIPPAAQSAFPDYGFNGPTITVQDALAWTAARASHVANHENDAVNAVNAVRAELGNKLDQLLSRPAPTADQIGTAVAGHLSGGGGASAQDIAAAVGHLFGQKLSV